MIGRWENTAQHTTARVHIILSICFDRLRFVVNSKVLSFSVDNFPAPCLQDSKLLFEVVELVELFQLVHLDPHALADFLLDFGALLHLLPKLLDGFLRLW